LKRGRPSKFNSVVVRQITRALSSGAPLKYAAARAGISFETLCAWRARFPEFDLAVEQAVARGVEQRLKKIQKAGESDWRALAWLLEHCQPETFAKSRIEVEAIGELSHRFVIPQKTLDEIAQARKQQEEKRVDPDRA
jgi:hypothetical protein